MKETILSEIDRGVHVLQIHRAEKKNALTVAMYEMLAEALRSADANPNVRVHLIVGTDQCFTAGNDLKDFLNNPPSGPDSTVYRFLGALIDASKPIVAGVSGPAIGIGTTMLLHCDLVIADNSAVFQLPFVDLGLCPEAASSYLMPMWFGYHQAAGLLLTGDRFSADDALRLGLVYEVVDGGSAVKRASDLADSLAGKPLASMMLTKQLMKDAFGDKLKETMSLESVHFVKRLESPEAKEAFQAFLERRPPNFNQA